MRRPTVPPYVAHGNGWSVERARFQSVWYTRAAARLGARTACRQAQRDRSPCHARWPDFPCKVRKSCRGLPPLFHRFCFHARAEASAPIASTEQTLWTVAMTSRRRSSHETQSGDSQTGTHRRAKAGDLRSASDSAIRADRTDARNRREGCAALRLGRARTRNWRRHRARHPVSMRFSQSQARSHVAKHRARASLRRVGASDRIARPNAGVG